MGPENALKGLLIRWCVANPVPLVLLVDEIDSLVGDTLLSVLRQLRAGYPQRPEGFPQSVVLCGVRDIRDYRIRSSAGEVIAGGSPFNVAAKSLRMGDFTEAETRALMAQHTEETGQPFSPAAQEAVWTQTRGQPWLVNALCAGACFDNKAGRDRSRSIEVDDVYAAREELILSRRTHLDQLAHKLEEERVRRVVEPLLSGGEVRHDGRDLEYLRDLGLLASDSPPRIANPIYREVVPRELGYVLQDSLDIQARWYVHDDGGLNMTKLLTAFGTFFGEHAEHWLGHLGPYREVAPQLILQSYLQRVVNGGGRIEREYGLGRGRTDLLVLWPRESGQPSDLWERFVVECKVLRDSDRKGLAWTVEKGVEQTLGYMKQCGAEEGLLVVMDRRTVAKEPRSSEDTEDRGGGEGEAAGIRREVPRVEGRRPPRPVRRQPVAGAAARHHVAGSRQAERDPPRLAAGPVGSGHRGRSAPHVVDAARAEDGALRPGGAAAGYGGPPAFAHRHPAQGRPGELQPLPPAPRRRRLRGREIHPRGDGAAPRALLPPPHQGGHGPFPGTQAGRHVGGGEDLPPAHPAYGRVPNGRRGARPLPGGLPLREAPEREGRRPGDDPRARAVGFLMSLYQRRLASSIHALRKSLENRARRLEEGLKQAEVLARAAPADLPGPDEIEEMEEGERERLEGMLEAVTLAANAEQVREEVAELRHFAGQARAVEASGTDAKLARLRDLLRNEGFFDRPGKRLLVFTEFRDTLDHLVGRLKDWGFAVGTIHGGMKPGSRDESGTRLHSEQRFREGAIQVLVATEAAGEGINLQVCHVLFNPVAGRRSMR